MSNSRPPAAADLHTRGVGGMTPLDQDPVVEEIHRIRENIAQSHGYDLDAIVADMQSRQIAHGTQLVRREPKHVTETDSETTPPPR
jgi:hypothetical protein